ncbi:MAG: sulfatase [Segetibacter sp.]
MQKLFYKSLIWVFIGFWSFLPCAYAEPGQKKPNIIFFLVDDMGWTDLGSYGSSFYQTPNIDKLAKQGIKFTDAYSTCTVCSPSRASILTGKYPAKLKLTDWIPGLQLPFAKLLPPNWKPFLPVQETTIAEVLKQQNYVTASLGKWHLGDDAKYYPENQGFDLNIAGSYLGHPHSYFSPYKMEMLKDGESGEYLTDRLTAEALKFIRNKQEKPFFLYIPYYAVHKPLQAKEEDVEFFKSKIKKDANHQNPVYAAMIKSVDESIGKIMELVNELKLNENTLIIFTSDNGGLLDNENWQNGKITSNAPLRSGKGSSYEGGVRVPAIMVWENKIKANTTSSVPIIGADFFPTISEIVEKKINTNSQIDGKSLAPLLFKNKNIFREALYWHYPHYHAQGAKPYSAIRQGDLKLIYFYETGKKELYNLKKDIGEQNDLYTQEPQIASALYTKLLNWKKIVGAQDPLINNAYDIKRASERKVREPQILKKSSATKEVKD